ncbi:TPA: septum formation initiator family protein [Candidatus Poribacteria bacterium]|nr:septum formation initiator family protein [Candidatus Poribacteria bacterium]
MRFVQMTLFLLTMPVLALGLYRFVEGFIYWNQCRTIHQDYIDEINRLKAERDKLQDYVKRLESDEFTQERIARKQGYIKKGETVYRIVP